MIIIQDQENALKALQEMKTIFDSQTYVVSSACNIQYNKVFPILDKELQRMSTEKITINCPKYAEINYTEAELGKSFSSLDLKEIDKKIVEELNAKLQELVDLGYKIIDFGIETLPTGRVAHIKYTS